MCGDALGAVDSACCFGLISTGGDVDSARRLRVCGTCRFGLDFAGRDAVNGVLFELLTQLTNGEAARMFGE